MAKGLICQVKNPCKSPTGGKKNQAKNKKNRDRRNHMIVCLGMKHQLGAFSEHDNDDFHAFVALCPKLMDHTRRYKNRHTFTKRHKKTFGTVKKYKIIFTSGG